jgi:peroxiredoxin Q/BCP
LQGQGLRDQAQQFADAQCDILGISFDTPAENLAFKQEHDFPFALLSDPTKEVGSRYQVLREADDKFVDYPQRISYLIDPDGLIVKSYLVSDPGGHAAAVLADLEAAQR